jgi:hypothetical protein
LEELGCRLRIEEEKAILRTFVNTKRDIVTEAPVRSARQLLFDPNNSNGCADPLRRGRQIKKITQTVLPIHKRSVVA